MPLTDYFDAYATRYQPYKGGRWCYEDGLLYLALVRLHLRTGDARWLDHLVRLTDGQITPDGRITGYDIGEYNIDNILSGRCLFHLADTVDQTRYMTAAAELIRQLNGHPRIDRGNYWHKQRYPHQVWLDGLFMALPFQVEYGLRTGEQGLVDDAMAQLGSALEVLTGPEGLFLHGYDHARAQNWADPVTGLSPAVWARAVGWLAMALVDLCGLLGDDPRAPRQATSELLTAIQHQQGASGLWQQVMLMPDLAGNYDESSASAMFAYALMAGARLGLTDDAGRVAGQRALDALVQIKLRDVDGITRLTDICCVAGLGGFDGVYRDGTPAYYIGETIVADDIKGVGPLAYAWTEA